MDAEKKAKEVFPCEIRLISLSRDSQTPITAFSGGPLPDPRGKTGGACTSALLQVLYTQEIQKDTSWSNVLGSMKQVLEDTEQIPQLLSSRRMDVNMPMDIVPTNHHSGSKTKKRAVLIGINYSGQQGELNDCHSDAEHMKEFLIQSHGFAEAAITVLMDKQGHSYYPTKNNLLACFRHLVTQSTAGDVAFVYFSGHSGRMYDEKDKVGHRYKETLIPVDVAKAGPIQADELYQVLFCAMPVGVIMTCVIDCCHGGSIIDLPYHLAAGDNGAEMYYDDSFSVVGAALGLAMIGGAATAIGIGAGASGGGTTSTEGAGNTTGNTMPEGCEEGCGGCCEGCFAALFGG